MSLKTSIFIGMTVGSIIGGYLPIIFGASLLSYWSLIGNGIGALLGIYTGYQLGDKY